MILQCYPCDHKRLQRKRDCWWKTRRNSDSCWFWWTRRPADTNQRRYFPSLMSLLNARCTQCSSLCQYLFQHAEECSLGNPLHFELIMVQFLHIRVQVRLQVHLFVQTTIDVPEHSVKGTWQNTWVFWRACAHTDTMLTLSLVHTGELYRADHHVVPRIKYLAHNFTVVITIWIKSVLYHFEALVCKAQNRK